MGKHYGNLGMEQGKGKRTDFELNLELSIGYGKKTEEEKEKEDSRKGEITKLFQENNNVSRSNFSSENNVDPQRKREIHALRRQEARRKREEKIKKSKGQNGLFVEDRLFLEAQKLQARVEERESRERDCVSEEKGRKINCSNGGELSLSLFSDNKNCTSLYPKVQQPPRNGFWAYSSADCDSEHSNGLNDRGNRMEQCSSAVSDYQTHKGGSSSDTGSHSSPLRPCLYPSIPKSLESQDSWSQAETDQVLGAAKLSALSSTILKSESSFDQTNTSSRSENPSRETSVSLNVKSPKSNANAAASIAKMPRVSTTGNGPNGRTIMGLLYKYTKMEVSILCVCHGSSFTPAEFVEHAGGVNISQPLKHITIVPS